MEFYKLKIRLGPHEFEAEGPQEAVERQFQAFNELVRSLQMKETSAEHETQVKLTENGPKDSPAKPGKFDKIFRAEGRIISLTAPPKEHKDGALLILLGQKIHRGNDTPTASEIADGLRRSGYNIPGRVDRTLDGFVSEGFLIKTGKRKGTRYRLTNTGLPRAETIAQRVQEMVP